MNNVNGKPDQVCLRKAKAVEKRKGKSKIMSANSGSPVTGIIDESQVVIDFGKYEGKTVYEVSLLDPPFYEKLATEKENGIFAIRRNRDKTFRLYINPLSSMDQ